MKILGFDLPIYSKAEVEKKDNIIDGLLNNLDRTTKSVVEKEIEEVNGKIAKSYSGLWNMYQFAPGAVKKDNYQIVNQDKLQEFATLLPNAPQTIEYIANVPFSLGYQLTLNENKVENEMLKKRIESFINDCNRYNQSLFTVLSTMIRWSCVTGDGYIEKVPTRVGNRLAEIYAVPSNQIFVYADQQAFDKGIFKVSGYSKIKDNATPPSEPQLKPNEVIHFKYIDKGEPYGHTPLEDNFITSDTIMKVLIYNYKKFSNEIRHSLRIHFPEGNEQEANRWYQMYRSQYLGEGRTGLPLMTWGDISVDVLQDEHQEFDFLQYMETIGKSHIPSLFNVSVSEIENSDTIYNNASQGHKSTIINTIYPIQNKMETIINNELIPQIEGVKEGLPTYKLVIEREDINERYDSANILLNALTQGVLTPNEWRKLTDTKSLPPITEAWADEYRLPQAPQEQQDPLQSLFEKDFIELNNKLDRVVKDKKRGKIK